MRKPRIVIGILVSLLLMLGLALPVAAEVDPTEVSADLEPGGSMPVTKTVTTPEIPPLIDILLLEDETGSFWDDIDELQGLAPAIWDAIAASGADFTMGVAGFRDFAQGPPPPAIPWGSPSDWVYDRYQDLTSVRANFIAGVNALSAGGGQDGPEAQLEALHYLATPGHAAIDSDGDGIVDPEDTPTGQQPTWRTGAVRVVLLATDAPCHVQGDSGGWPGDAGTASAGVTAGILSAAGITVIGLTPGGAGTIPQIDTLATGTGGSVHATTATGETIKEAILAGLAALTTDVWWEVEADKGLTVTLSPDKYLDVEGETTVSFTETITVDNDVEPCTTLKATVTFYANNYLAGEGGVVGEQEISIHVVPVPVEIDIKPGSDPNSINLNGNGVVPVGVFGTATFDVNDIDVSTVLFGVDGDEAAAVHSGHIEDLDGDGTDDMVLHFREGELGIPTDTPGNATLDLLLSGKLNDDRAFEGKDVVRITPNSMQSRGKGGKGPK